jgi:hypothetical protein
LREIRFARVDRVAGWTKVSRMTVRDGRKAKEPYRVRVGPTWYWVDPTTPAADLEAGDTVVIYPVNGDAHLAVLQSKFDPAKGADLASLAGERFALTADEIEALHLAAVDDVQ